MRPISTVHARVNDFVKNYLKETGINQSFIAKKMGYTPNKLSELLNGRAVMRIEDLERICDFFDIPVTMFIPYKQKNEGA